MKAIWVNKNEKHKRCDIIYEAKDDILTRLCLKGLNPVEKDLVLFDRLFKADIVKDLGFGWHEKYRRYEIFESNASLNAKKRIFKKWQRHTYVCVLYKRKGE